MAKMQVTANSGLYVRTGPSTSYKKVKALPKGAIVNTSESRNGWHKHDQGGWSSGSYLKAIDTPKAKPSPNKPAPKPTPVLKVDTIKPPDRYNSSYTGGYVGVKPIKKLKTVLNMPYQFMSHVDDRVPSSDYGRKFGENIVMDAPIVTFKVGVPKFLGTNMKKIQENALKSVLNGTPNILKEIIGDKNRDLRYYTFEDAYTSYMEFVNSMCRQAAAYMDLGREYYMQDLDYLKRASMSDTFFLGSKRNVTFYMDVSSSFNEGPNNSTGESMLSSGMKTVSDTVKEAEFLLGAGLGFDIDLASTEEYNESLRKITKRSNKNPNSISSRIGNVVHNLKHGGNLIFPEMWKESSYSKSYSIKIRLVAPYGTKECVFNEIMIPLYHLLALTLPKSLTPNGYVSPFLIRAYSKGWFNCEMGIVDSIDITKAGDGDQWSVDGLPTQLDVTLSIRDLYPVMAMTQHKYGFLFSANTPLLDYIANMSGVNLTDPPLRRNVEAFVKRVMAQVGNIDKSIYKKADDVLFNMMDFFSLNSRY